MAEHVITRDAPTHRTWDVDHEPVVRIQPGDVVTAETADFAGGQITRDSTAADLPNLDFNLIYPLAGPIYVEGAEPGDAVAIEFLDFELPEWRVHRALHQVLRPDRRRRDGLRARRAHPHRAVLWNHRGARRRHA
jgi:acetamidase/formamidase